MNMKLLKKIEELTLYLMEQDKKNYELLLLLNKHEQRIQNLEKKSQQVRK